MESVIYADKAKQVTISNNNTDWPSNYTRCYKLHNLVIVVITCRGAPAGNKIISSGLPIPAGNRGIELYIGNPVSVALIETDGTLKISSPGTLESIYIGQTVAYLAEN